ncbi:hypothetical protein SAMN04487866_11164 [Thermoactinomyces sp. DSM 45891]|uniref:hypothetical protein n=1 Tax=Thermoactinomyces sp. DSM 45891 TaxID=1761907 RepID=UPI00092066D5|nr:hypothetical protein [Thermoactinomyces sp. DSM 45891]SFX55136.1 hypothetical protein SAMN04487866_11164 [Thermoactinomyces sp. DSM 45891]
MTRKKVLITFVYVKDKNSKSTEELRSALDAKNRAIDIFTQLVFQEEYMELESGRMCGDESSFIC